MTTLNHSYAALSYRFRFKTSIPRVGSRIAAYLGPLHTNASGEGPVYSVERLDERGPGWLALCRDGSQLWSASSLDSVLRFLLTDVTRMAVEQTVDRLVVHAGAVSLAGQAVLMPAPPSSGKTTLTAGLVRSGFSYLSDEAVAIDRQTYHVVPFPRPLAMSNRSLRAVFGDQARSMAPPDGQQTHVAPDALRAGAVTGPCAIRFVVIPRYRAGARTALAAISRAEGVHWMLRNSFNLSTLGSAGLEDVAHALRGADCFRLTIGSLHEAVPIVRGLSVTGAPVRRGS